MASSKAYLDFILEQLSDLEEITYRAMMGGYIIYYRGKIVGGIYDDRLLVKPDDIDNKEFLTSLFITMYDDLRATKKRST